MCDLFPADLRFFHPMKFCEPVTQLDLVAVLRTLPDVTRVDVLEDRTVVRVRFLTGTEERRRVEETALRAWRSRAWHDGRSELHVRHRWRSRRVA